MCSSAAMTRDALELRADETALVCLDASFIAGKMMLVRSFLVHMKIVAVEPSSNPFLAIPADVDIDFTAFVPLQLHAIMNSSESGRINGIRNILVGGASIDNGMATSLARFNSRIFSTYGMTETVSHVALWHVNNSAGSKHFVPLPGVKCRVDKRGCLVLDVPFLSQPVITNDLVDLKDDGGFTWLGRADNIINTGGLKIVPERLEQTIGSHFKEAGIDSRFIISGLHDAVLGSRLVLLVEEHLNDLIKEKLKDALRKNLSRYENPKEIYDGIQFILTKSGKIDRLRTAAQIGK
jgi:O-succinylbenzoic acid--CoA ligase